VLPPLRALLGTAVPGLADLAVIAAGAVLPLLVNEASKAARRTGGAPQEDA
jgi:hypothetical protein